MAGISSLGIGSGLDIRSLVDQLVAAERAPRENRINRQQQRLQTQLSGFGQVKSALTEFREQVRKLSDTEAFQQMKATSSDSDSVKVSAASDAAMGRYDIGVNRLAEAQGLASGAFADTTTTVGSGTLTFRFGEVSTNGNGAVSAFTENTERGAVDIQIPDSAKTLADVRDAVNDADTGVRASIVNDGSGQRLVFSSGETGAANGFVIETTDSDGNNTDDAGLSQLAFNTAASNVEQTRSAADAELTVDGLTVTRASNSVDDLIGGLTLTLNATTDHAAKIEVRENRGAARKQIEGFVDAYNGFQGTLNKLTGYDAATDRAGPLNGNGLVRSIAAGLQRTIGQTLPELESAGVRSLADIGVATKRDGTLEIKTDELDAALENNFRELGALFAPTGLAAGAGNVDYVSSRTATQGGQYGISVSAVATRGSLAGSAVSGGFPITVDGSNNRLRLEIDGVQTAALDLTQGSYASGADLAAEIQSRINGDSNLREAGVSANVAFENGALEITSARYGSESTVSVTVVDTNTTATLGLAVGDGTAGTDVQGTIDGNPAEGFGRYLTGTEGGAEGLKLEVAGEHTGSRGSVTYSRGLMSALGAQIDSYIDTSGTLTSSTESLNDRLESLQDDRRDLVHRMARVEQRYTEQFSAMDALVAQLNQTSSFLTRQLASLPGAGGNDDG